MVIVSAKAQQLRDFIIHSAPENYDHSHGDPFSQELVPTSRPSTTKPAPLLSPAKQPATVTMHGAMHGAVHSALQSSRVRNICPDKQPPCKVSTASHGSTHGALNLQGPMTRAPQSTEFPVLKDTQQAARSKSFA